MLSKENLRVALNRVEAGCVSFGGTQPLDLPDDR